VKHTTKTKNDKNMNFQDLKPTTAVSLTELVDIYKKHAQLKFDSIYHYEKLESEYQTRILNLKSIPVSERERDYKQILKSDAEMLETCSYLKQSALTEHAVYRKVLRDLEIVLQ